jgi:hypothetical protein
MRYFLISLRPEREKESESEMRETGKECEGDKRQEK